MPKPMNASFMWMHLPYRIMSPASVPHPMPPNEPRQPFAICHVRNIRIITDFGVICFWKLSMLWQVDVEIPAIISSLAPAPAKMDFRRTGYGSSVSFAPPANAGRANDDAFVDCLFMIHTKSRCCTRHQTKIANEKLNRAHHLHFGLLTLAVGTMCDALFAACTHSSSFGERLLTSMRIQCVSPV